MGGDGEVLVVVGVMFALWAACFVSLFLYLKRTGARFSPRSRTESGILAERVEVPGGIGGRIAYGRQISLSATSDFSHLPADLRRRCENAIKLATGVMAASLLGTTAFIFLR